MKAELGSRRRAEGDRDGRRGRRRDDVPPRRSRRRRSRDEEDHVASRDGPPGRALRAQEALRAARRPPVRAHDGCGHARRRARAEDGREGSAVVYKPLSSGDFTRVDNDAEALIKQAGRSAGSEVERKTDSFGFEWLARLRRRPRGPGHVGPRGRPAADRAGLRGAAARRAVPVQGRRAPGVLDLRLQARGVLAVRPDRRGQKRDNATELELKAKLEKELPVEQDLTRWLALFDSPVSTRSTSAVSAGIACAARGSTPSRGLCARRRQSTGRPISRAISARAARRFSMGG